MTTTETPGGESVNYNNIKPPSLKFDDSLSAPDISEPYSTVSSNTPPYTTIDEYTPSPSISYVYPSPTETLPPPPIYYQVFWSFFTFCNQKPTMKVGQQTKGNAWFTKLLSSHQSPYSFDF